MKIISSNLNRFPKLFNCWKVHQISNINDHIRNVLPHYPEKLKCSNVLHFCTLYAYCVQWNAATFKLMVVISWHRITKCLSRVKFHGPFCEYAAYLLDSKPDHWQGQHFSSVRHCVVCRYLWVCWLCNDVILMTQFPNVVWQHILSVMFNVVYCFVAHLTDVPAK